MRYRDAQPYTGGIPARKHRARKFYKEERARGTRAAHALHAARINARFWELDGDFVKIEAEIDPYIDVRDLLETCYDEQDAHHWPGGKRTLAARKKEFLRSLECDGAYGLVSYYRTDDTAPWIIADSIWGFVGDPNTPTGYEPELKAAAIKALVDALKEERRAARAYFRPRPSQQEANHAA